MHGHVGWWRNSRNDVAKRHVVSPNNLQNDRKTTELDRGRAPAPSPPIPPLLPEPTHGGAQSGHFAAPPPRRVGLEKGGCSLLEIDRPTHDGAQSGHFAAPPPRRVGLEKVGCSLLDLLRRAVGALCSPSTAPSWAGLGLLKTLPRRASSGVVAMPAFRLGLSCVVRMLVLWRRALALGAPLRFPAACRAPPSRAPGRAAPSAPFPVSRRLRFAPGVGGAPGRPPPSPGPPPPFLPRRFVSLRAARILYSHPFFLSSTVQEWSEGSVIIYRVTSVGGLLGVVLSLAALLSPLGWSGAVASGFPRFAAECP